MHLPNPTPVDQQLLRGITEGTLTFWGPCTELGKRPPLSTQTCVSAPTFHSPSFLTLRMTPLRISTGKEEGEKKVCDTCPLSWTPTRILSGSSWYHLQFTDSQTEVL